MSLVEKVIIFLTKELMTTYEFESRYPECRLHAILCPRCGESMKYIQQYHFECKNEHMFNTEHRIFYVREL